MKSEFADKKSRMGKPEEEKFRTFFKNFNCWIFRIPDFAVTGLKGSAAPADYLIVYKGKSYLFEVKHTNSLTSFSISDITDGQMIGLKQHREKGEGESFFVFFNPEGVWFVNEIYIESYIKTAKRKSIPFPYIKKMGMDKEAFMYVFKNI